MSRSPPDAIILNIQVPCGTGRAVLRQLKTHPETRQMPVIVVTGSYNPKDHLQFLQHGASDFLNKAVDPDRLFSSLDNLIGVAV